MELFRGTAPKVTFYLPTDNTSSVSATWALDGVDRGVLSVPTPVDGSVEVQLPYLQYDGQVAINWTFSIPGSGTFTDRIYYDVVTPILTKQEVKAIYETDQTDEEYATAEAAVRHVINAHCGQSFGKSIATWTVNGDASRSLDLPVKLLEVYNVNGDASEYYTIAGGGFNLRHYPFGVTGIKTDDGTLQRSGVIYDPYSISTQRYSKHQTYSIYGVWGYNAVPATVKAAAKLLINDYACEDAAYRDRYLTSMTAADWRIQFNAGAFINTGNVRADQLLEPFVMVRGLAVL